MGHMQCVRVIVGQCCLVQGVVAWTDGEWLVQEGSVAVGHQANL